MEEHNINYVNQLRKTIINSNKIALISHKDPDGDCLGSLLGLGEMLNNIGKKVFMFIEGEIPLNYRFLPTIEKIISKPTEDNFDMVILLDSSDIDRIGIMNAIVNKSNSCYCIDHHESNKGFCDINIIEPNYSSTGEIIYEISKLLDFKISVDTAINLYTAILTDTGKFIYDNTSPQTLRYVAELLDKNFGFSDVVDKIYGNDDKNIFMAKSRILSEVEFYFDGKLSLGVINQAILDEFNIAMKDIDGIVEAIRDIRGVGVSCVLKQVRPDKTKVSLRSKGDFNVSDISLLFDGGGHKRAAGFDINDNLENSKLILINELSKYLED